MAELFNYRGSPEANTDQARDTEYLKRYLDLLKDRKDITPLERTSLDLLTQCADGCERIFNQLSTGSKRNKEIEALADGRPTEDKAHDTYVAHGARVARNVVELGVLDPLTFCIAYLHDLGGKQVLSFSSNKIRTYLTEVLVDPELVQAVIDGIKAFDTQDSRSKMVTDHIFSQNYKVPFGENFTPVQYARLQEAVIRNHTNGIDDIGIVVRRDEPKIQVKEESEDPLKFPVFTKVIRQATAIKKRSKQEGESVRAEIGKRVQFSVHTAYLAAAIDNIDHPKKGRKLADMQKIALGLQHSHLPLYWAMGDLPAHRAEEIIFKAFFPEAYSNMMNAWNEIQSEQEGEYIENQRAIYEKFVRKQIVGRIAALCPDVQPVPESEMVVREEELRKKGLPEIQIRKTNLLNANEIYMPPINIKTPPSIFRKGLKHFLEHTLFHGHGGKRILSFDISSHPFRSKEFWKNYIQRSYDILRTRIIMGDDVIRDAAQVFEEIEQFIIVDPDKKVDRKKEVEPDEEVEPTYTQLSETEMEKAWGINSAHVPFQVDPTQRRRELIEHKVFPPDNRTSVQHYVLRPPIEGLDLNLELHVSGQIAYILGYVGQSHLSHLNYKLTEQIEELARASKLNSDQRNLLKEFISQLISNFKHEYVRNTPIIGYHPEPGDLN